MFPLINEANGSGMVWAVMDSDYAHLAMQQLAPEAAQFPRPSNWSRACVP